MRPRFFTTSILRVRERLVLRGGAMGKVPLRVRVGHVHHPALGHTLIDAGYSTHVTRPAAGRPLLRAYGLLLNPSVLHPDPLTLGLARLGLSREDIDTVVVTHLHADHIGGLRDLPRARLLASRAGWDAMRRAGPAANARHGVFPSLLPDDAEARMAFIEDRPPCRSAAGPGFDLTGDGAMVAVPLPGHVEGHFGLDFPAPGPGREPFLYACDAQWLVRAIVEDRMPNWPARLITHDPRAARASVERLRGYVEAGGDVLTCHDPHPHTLDLDHPPDHPIDS